ncbi:hypothetical protein COHA_003000 [Chlorella ohadii]|uniref:Beta-galactosidase n=1 Tax=Chlorella ohadii TaxID=2649997 RepID=A0AAD5DTK4_9CHLO|nr:hypothetical protein COHA_003000 [Chlorella ohadii]
MPRTIAQLLLLAVWAAGVAAGASGAVGGSGSFGIKDDQLILDGKPIQVISGSMHYFRIHPSLWEDRLARAAAMGINTVEVYTPWNMHEPYPGQYVWSGMADLERWMDLIQEAGLKVLLRPGPYICAEWDNGGFPHWFASSKVAGGRTMRMRTNDPVYLDHVERWWAVVFSKLRHYLHANGGPILMVQVENEYGFCGEDKDYLRRLMNITRTHLSSDVLLFTTDPPGVASRGSIMGEDLYTVVDFGPGWFDPSSAFAAQAAMNAPGKSPPFCSEFYTGWLTHWGEAMANTSTEVLVKDTKILLEWANSTASLSFYMIHGGTNFGFWAGANVDGERYLPHITSYDYDAPISEAGDYCQPGIGGGCKYYVLRDLIAKHTGRSLPEPPPRPAIRSYGRVDLKDSLPLMEAVPALFSGGGIRAEVPDIMEEYGQRWGLILYRTQLPAKALDKDGALDLGSVPHDYATVFVDGELAGRLDRSEPATNLTLPARHTQGKGKGNHIQLDILVEAMGRQNFGCDTGNWDWKGLTSQNVTLNGKRLRVWEVFPLQLDDVSDLAYASGRSGDALLSAARRLLAAPAVVGARNADAPAFFRGTFEVDAANAVRGPSGHLADTYLALHSWSKGIAWVNGFNLGWYWPRLGPQMTLYVPGPVLREGSNEVVLLELERPAHDEAVVLDDKPDFWGPSGGSAAAANNGPQGSFDEGNMDYKLAKELDHATWDVRRAAVTKHLELLYQASQSQSERTKVEQCECCSGSGERECGWCHGTGKRHDGRRCAVLQRGRLRALPCLPRHGENSWPG